MDPRPERTSVVQYLDLGAGAGARERAESIADYIGALQPGAVVTFTTAPADVARRRNELGLFGLCGMVHIPSLAFP
jgi:hypothetical protein